MPYVELEVNLATPLLAGSADPNKVDEDYPIRPSEVKGLWRWWARAWWLVPSLIRGGFSTAVPRALCLRRQALARLGLSQK